MVKLKNYKKLVLGLFLTLVGTNITISQLQAHAPGGPRISSYQCSCNQEKDTWQTICDTADTVKEVSYAVGSTAYEAVYLGLDATLAGISFVKKASVFAYALAQRGWQATKWAAVQGNTVYRWITNKEAQEARATQAQVHARMIVASAKFV